MRVLMVVHGFPPWATGGTEVYASQLAGALARQGEDVVVLTREADPDRAEHEVRHELRDGIALLVVNNTFRVGRSFRDGYDHAAVTAAAAGVLDEVRPDVAHVHHLIGLSTGLVKELARRRIPTLMTLHDYWLMCHRGQLVDTRLQPCPGPRTGCVACGGVEAAAGVAGYAGARVVRAVGRRLPALAAALRRLAAGAGSGPSPAAERRMAERAHEMRAVVDRVDRFLAPSRALAEHFLARGLPRAKLRLTELGVDPRPFGGIARTAAPVLRLGFVGSLMVSKAPHVLLDALAMLPPGVATLDLLGEAAAYHGNDSYRQLLASYAGRPGVRFRGPIPRRDLPAALADLDVLVVPSIWPENSPCVIREAFLAGLPVVASAVGGIPELVQDGVAGLLVPPGEPGTLAAALRRLTAEPGLLDRLRAGIPRVRGIDEDATAVREHYAELVAVAPEATPRLAAVVLNFGTPDDTILAVRSLQSSRRRADHVVVVDNASPDGSAEVLTRRLAGVDVLRSPANLGYSAGCNLGIRHALAQGAELIFLLNSDAMVDPDCLGTLEDALARTPGAGLAGPTVLRREDPAVVETAGIRFVSRWGRMKNLESGRPWHEGARTTVRVAAVSGCALLVRHEVLEAVGLLEEDYFFAFEDLDLALRAAGAGWWTLAVGDAVAYHAGSRSIGAAAPRRLYYGTRNQLLLARRRVPRGHLSGMVRAGLIIGYSLAHAAREGGAPLPSRVGAVVRGVRDHLRRRYGAG